MKACRGWVQTPQVIRMWVCKCEGAAAIFEPATHTARIPPVSGETWHIWISVIFIKQRTFFLSLLGVLIQWREASSDGWVTGECHKPAPADIPEGRAVILRLSWYSLIITQHPCLKSMVHNIRVRTRCMLLNQTEGVLYACGHQPSPTRPIVHPGFLSYHLLSPAILKLCAHGFI